MQLHQDNTLFRQAIQATAQRMQIPEIYVEKDYWVTFALYTIFTGPLATDAVFKGGTALAKCFGIIERFSEDIDLVVLRKEDETDSKLKAKLKKLSQLVAQQIPEIELEGLTHKMGMIRKTVHEYPKTFKGSYGQVRDVLVLESTWLGRYEPYHHTQISCYIYEMMQAVGQQDLAEKQGLLPFTVQVLDVRRTICEKIMSLVRFSYGENPVEQLKNKIRHTYDIHQLLELEEISNFFINDEFERMLKVVAADDKLSFKKDNDWLDIHPKEALIFAEPENVWEKLKATYTDSFKALVYGVLPEEKAVLETLIKVSERLQQIEKWTFND